MKKLILFATLAMFSCGAFAGHYHGRCHGYWSHGVYYKTCRDYDRYYYLNSGYGPGWYDRDGYYHEYPRHRHHRYRHYHRH